MTPDSVQIHEDWDPDDESFDADIAIMTFKKGSIRVTMYSKPICLWEEEEEVKEEQFGSAHIPEIKPVNPSENGTVSGWGQSQYVEKSEPIPTKLTIPIDENKFCISANDELEPLSSQRTICGGAGDGSGICFGDSGGSLVVEVESTFYFRGIISSSLMNEVNSCDVETYQIYTDVLQYRRWIKNKMKQVVCRIIPNQ